MPELERWVLHRIAELDGLVRRCTDDFDFHTLFTQVHQFCAVDLSAFYFDVRKDSLYCDRPDSDRRRAVRTVRSEEHTSELQSLMRISYAVLCLKKKNKTERTQPKKTQKH